MPTLAVSPLLNGSHLSFEWVRTADGVHGLDHGSGDVSSLPKERDVVLVLPARWVSWHRVSLPKLAAPRLRAVLEGVMEDRLLQDVEHVHFALPSGGPTQGLVWIACCERWRLRQCFEALQASGLPPARIIPSQWPIEPDQAVVRVDADPDDHAWVSLSTARGVGHWPLNAVEPLLGGLGLGGRVLSASVPAHLVEQVEAVLGVHCSREARPMWLLHALKSPWNLAQFEFKPSSHWRERQRWQKVWRAVCHERAGRPLRWSVSAFLLVQLLGLNLYAWQLRQQLQDTRTQQRQALQTAFPTVKLVIDPVIQMQRELDGLRQRSGTAEAADLEALLASMGRAAVSASWSGLAAIEHDASSTRLTANSLGEALLRGWQGQLSAAGLQAQTEDQSVVVRR